MIIDHHHSLSHQHKTNDLNRPPLVHPLEYRRTSPLAITNLRKTEATWKRLRGKTHTHSLTPFFTDRKNRKREQKQGRQRPDISEATTCGMEAHYYPSAMSYPAGGSSSGHGPSGNPSVRKSRSVRSEGDVSLQGPLDVAGSVKSGRSITLSGDFTIDDKMEAYGSIDIHGNVTCG